MVRNNMLSYVSLASCSMLGKVNLWCHNTKAKSCIHYWSTIYQCNFLVAIGWTYRRVFFKYAFLNTNIMLHLNTQFQIESGLGHLLCNMWKYVQIITFADSEKLCWTINVSYTCYMLKAYALLKVAEHVFCIMLSWPPCSEAACVCALLLPPTWRSPLFLLAPKQLKKNFWEASSFFPYRQTTQEIPCPRDGWPHHVQVLSTVYNLNIQPHLLPTLNLFVTSPTSQEHTVVQWLSSSKEIEEWSQQCTITWTRLSSLIFVLIL